MWFYLYEALHWDELKRKSVLTCGIVAADKFTDAMNIVEDWYEDNLSEVKLSLMSENIMDFEVNLEEEHKNRIIKELTKKEK